jgi:tetratricopeptide (TPR) repeat protein
MDAAVLVADLCQRLGRVDESIAVLKEQLAINPTAGAALQLAQAYMTAGRYDAMEEALQTAARIEPDNGFVHMLRGDRLSAEGDVAGAIREYEEALRLDPNRLGLVVRPVLDKLKGQAAKSRTGS